MYSKLYSASVLGVDGYLVEVEVDLANGLPTFDIIGLGDTAVRESRDRVRSALKNGGYTFPMKRITTNLAPADVRKEGSAFDLAIAIGILHASDPLCLTSDETALQEQLKETLFLGELSLEGTLRPTHGVLAMVMAAAEQGIKRVILPCENQAEASLIGIETIPVTSLQDAVSAIKGDKKRVNVIPATKKRLTPSHDHIQKYDFSDVRGQHHAKRAMEIAAAGMHNILMMGPPGSGKTMLARRLPGILPAMTQPEALQVTKVYSATGKLPERGMLMDKRPFRSPHHSVTRAGFIGGGNKLQAGEVTMAHQGILFLDEIPEFSRQVLEVLRQPLEDGEVTLSRGRGSVTLPAQVMLVGSMNPCHCGYHLVEDGEKVCECTPAQIRRYRNKVSGPLLDRIDLHIELPRQDHTTMMNNDSTDSTREIRERVNRARERQASRFKASHEQASYHMYPLYNAQMPPNMLKKYCSLKKEAQEMLKQAFESLGISMRAHDRILKVARTIADLDGKEEIELTHVAEAVQYRGWDGTEPANAVI